ncbi:hypothetical protein SAMN05443574_10343 [Haloarcula vallismortis]|uniref:Uncharacterized protein n=2 Tax=Haloarcula vallismortis TaxID=28442 RepID=M0JSI7_HALVA|nr:hypothetical protein [Haloarcula vallismortis]EMA11343.1 hypothetical protein C437_00485 [Haloarcula vallismortis ATCC 29715]SDW38524.1 hypothetical protein SAMN05443574_10343 [Haloarcula vallismortis]
MRRLPTFGWAFLVSIWAGLVGGAVIREPSVDLVPLYAVICQLFGLVAAYWTMRERDHILDSVHRPGRVGMFIIVLFFVMVPLSTIFALALGATSVAGVATQWLSYLVGLGSALYVAFAGGFDRAWEEYT